MLLNIKKVAELLDVGQMTVYRMINDGRINAVKIGRTLRVDENEIEKIRKQIKEKPEFKKENKFVKLPNNYFDDPKIKMIKSFENGDAIALFWLEILFFAEKINNNNLLSLTNNIPYDSEMLASHFGKSKAFVENAMSIFTNYKMVQKELINISIFYRLIWRF